MKRKIEYFNRFIRPPCLLLLLLLLLLLCTIIIIIVIIIMYYIWTHQPKGNFNLYV